MTSATPSGASPSSEISARDGAVETIVNARKSGTAFQTLDPFAPQTIDAAYAIADRVHELLGQPVIGWKIGCTSELAQRMLGTDGPMCGRVYEQHPTGSSLKFSDYQGAHLEGEFAFTMGTDLEPISQQRTPQEISRAIASLHPCIELVGGRCSDFLATPINSTVADCGANTAIIVGDAVENWTALDLVSMPGSMTIDGTIVGEGTGADVLGEPLLALTWLVNHLSERGITVHAGDIVTTGTCTGLAAAVAGTTAVGDFGRVGQVRVDFT